MQLDETKDALLEAIDKAVSAGSWEASLFYKNMLKKILFFREEIASKLNVSVSSQNASEHVEYPSLESKQDCQKVYVGLYQADSASLERWLVTIKSLMGAYVNRPVYRLEEHVQEVIRAKRSHTDAYIAVWVKSEDILPLNQGMQSQDRFGHDLLNVRPGSIQLQNVIEFVHDKKAYRVGESGLTPYESF